MMKEILVGMFLSGYLFMIFSYIYADEILTFLDDTRDSFIMRMCKGDDTNDCREYISKLFLMSKFCVICSQFGAFAILEYLKIFLMVGDFVYRGLPSFW